MKIQTIQNGCLTCVKQYIKLILQQKLKFDLGDGEALVVWGRLRPVPSAILDLRRFLLEIDLDCIERVFFCLINK